MTTIRVTIRPEHASKFIDWQTKLHAVIAGFPGFVSLEFLSAPETADQWAIVLRFNDHESASAWKSSPSSLDLMQELEELNVDHDLKEVSETESDSRSGVTEILVTEVSPDREEEYREWIAKIHQVEATFPGFRGVFVQSPRESQGRHWITLLQFDTPDHLDLWLESPERHRILKESSAFIASLESHRVVSPFAGWFASIAKTGEIPPVWKQTMIVLVVLFPIVMLELKYLSPLTQNLNSALGTFIGNAISVALISFPMMPIAIWLLGWWLSPGEDHRMQKTIIGTAIVLLLYLLEILLFWNLL